MNIDKLNADLLHVSNQLKQIETAISEMYGTDIAVYHDIIPLINTDNAKSYRTIGRAFNFVIDQYNLLISRHLFIDEMGDTAVPLRYIRLNDLLVRNADRIARFKIQELLSGLSFVTDALASMGVDFDMPDWTTVATLSETYLGTTQGAGFDDDYYYVFGSVGATGGKMILSVTHRRNPELSFTATGDLGNLLAGNSLLNPTDNALGHANDCAVIERNGDEVTLLVSSMIENEMATCIVNLRDHTARIGVRIPLYGVNSAQYSVQVLANNQIMIRASEWYWVADYNQTGMHFTKFARHAEMNSVVRDLGYNSNAVYQADWFENGRLYTTAWLPQIKSSVIVETMPNGVTDRAIPTGKHWLGSGDGRKFEIEKVWFDNGKMYANIALANPYEHLIIKPKWEEK